MEGVEDAVVLTKNEAGNIRVKPYFDLLASEKGVKSEFWGSLISTLMIGFDNEVHEKFGLTRKDVTNLMEMLEPNSSAIFVLRRKFNLYGSNSPSACYERRKRKCVLKGKFRNASSACSEDRNFSAPQLLLLKN